MVDKGYAEICPSNTYYSQNTQLNLNNIRLYLPHFGIYHPQKRKLRVVHDAAAMNEGVSLNSLLLQGPDLLQNLLHILFRFREGRVALTADIKEMFPQIRIRHEDRDALRFLWRDGDQKQLIKEYRMTSVIFGASSSPFMALYIKNKNAEEHEQCFPNAAKAIIEDHYMDDYLGSHDSSEIAAKIARDIVTVHNAACFEMREWVSNDVTALRLIPADLCAKKPSEVSLGSSPTVVRVLGIVWDPNSDTLGFRTGLDETFPAQLTKRKVLSHLMRVYDPLGLLGPIVIKGRILFQNNWRSNTDWDSELSPTETSKWLEWFNELLTVSTFKIPRWYSKAFDAEPLQRELHIFCDASESAYACVAYWRLLYADKSVKLAIIGSKARVAPLKPISIPRLELMAALIASRLAVTIKDSHVKKPSKTFFWTDSTTVLSWLRSDARSFKPFVAHRIGEITENSSISDWKWVPTGMNVADDATRLHSAQLNQSSRWFTGPTFLLLSSEDWPKEPVSEVPSVQSQVELKSSPIEMVGVLTEHTGKTCAVTADCSRFSSWLRLVRATARVHQAAFIFRQLIRNSRFSGHRRQSLNTSTITSLIPLTAEFMNAAERHILWKIQLDSFLEDITCILNSKPLPRTSRLAKLSPMIGDDKLLRLGGRIRAADVDQNVKTPVLLDGSHPVARLLVYQFHVKMGHANDETVINELRQHYWILRLRSTVRTVAHRCLFCKIRKSLPQAPPTGNLPQERMAHHKRCFTFTGLDYFGPVSVTIGRRREKRYVALFTCLTSRAVHLELAHTLSADSAIACIRRFIARRGAPDTFFSDNGTAFVGANKILREFYSNGVEDFAANNGVKWHFIPPAAPNFGGCWERLVRSIKQKCRYSDFAHFAVAVYP
ncbi:hypothetical protein K1T71_000718 [Dendrolimus kikuchii]|uniref:Uncharacterized protein n=1 Tax=Dendrolimus kikuchii TaxID=765133 RepID=A0ACC1DK84_9NEOP|nr:hypothetical protein K1T71_000718 [Dendrolimus kikuchii]